MGWLIWILVGREVRVLATTAKDIARRTPESLEPIESKAVPDEVQPLVGALNDLNSVRQISGNLAALTAADVATAPLFTNRLLYERWMSLLMEGHRWNDYRRFGRLAALPLDITSGANAHFVARVMPIPQQECDARKTGTGTWSTPAGTCQ